MTEEVVPPTAQRRRLWRFSITSMLVLVTAAGAFLGWLRFEIVRIHREERVLQTLPTVIGDGQVNTYYGHRFKGDETPYMLPFVPADSHRIEELFGIDPFRTVKRLTIYAVGNTFSYRRNDDGSFNVVATYVSGLKDQDAALLQQLEHLEFLALEGSPIGNEGLAQLTPLQSIRHLNVAGSKVTKDGIRHIVKFTAIRELNLSNTEITDASLELLASVPLDLLIV